MEKSDKAKEGERRRKKRWEAANREKHLEGNRRRNQRWVDKDPEHVKALNRKKAKAHYYRNQEEVRAQMRARAKVRWAAMSIDERKDFKLRESYGITLLEWQAILAQQNGSCAICRTTTPGGRGWQTDHCHKEGVVRGLLCTQCNTALGLVKESIDVLLGMIDYLRR